MSERKKIYLLIGLLAVLAAVYFLNRNHGPAMAGARSGEVNFRPLNVPDPQLRLDRLASIQKLEYAGSHRNIFSAQAPPMEPSKGSNGAGSKKAQDQVPPTQPPPPPLDVPVTFFGYATSPQSGKRLAFFTNGEDVYIVPEGGSLLNRFKLLKIGNATVDLEEVSSGRRTTVNMELPPASSQ